MTLRHNPVTICNQPYTLGLSEADEIACMRRDSNRPITMRSWTLNPMMSLPLACLFTLSETTPSSVVTKLLMMCGRTRTRHAQISVGDVQYNIFD